MLLRESDDLILHFGEVYNYFIVYHNVIIIEVNLVAQLVKNLPAMRRPGFDPWIGKIPWRRERQPTPVLWPGELHGLSNPWCHQESDTTERLSLCHTCHFAQ